MDIKNALNSILPIQRRENTSVDRAIKAGNTTDRDANGQMGYDQQKKHHDPMTPEQLEKAIKAIEDFPAIKENNLTVELVDNGNRKVVILKEPSGKVLRRITEEELWTLPAMSETDPHKQKGQLIRRTA